MQKQTSPCCSAVKGHYFDIKHFCLGLFFVMDSSEVVHYLMEDLDYNFSDGCTSDEEEGCTGYSTSALDILDIAQVCFCCISANVLVTLVILLKWLLVM